MMREPNPTISIEGDPYSGTIYMSADRPKRRGSSYEERSRGKRQDATTSSIQVQGAVNSVRIDQVQEQVNRLEKKIDKLLYVIVTTLLTAVLNLVTAVGV